MTEPLEPASLSRNPRLPADHGLPALGIIMKLNASLWMAVGVFYLMTLIIVLTSTRETGIVLAFVAVVIAGLVRGGMHIAAANALVARQPHALTAVRRYISSALIFTLLAYGALALALKGSVPFAVLGGVAILSLWWPAAVALMVYRRSIKQMFAAADTFDVNLVPADRSIEGLGVMMTCFAAVFVALNVVVLVLLAVNGALSELIGVLFTACLALFTFRSAVHLRAGVAAMNGLTPLAFLGRASSYFAISLVSVIAFAVLLIWLAAAQGAGGQLILVALGVGLLLMMWPIIVSGFAQRAVLLDADLDGEGTIRQGPAPDRGLTAFGYLLVFVGGSGLSMMFVQLLAMAPLPFIGGLTEALTDGADGTTAASLALSFVKGAAAVVAGVACITMHRRYPQALFAFAALWLVASVVESFIIEDVMSQLDDGLLDSGAAALMAFQLAVAFIGPILAVVLARRKLPPADLDRHTPPSRALDSRELALMDQL